MSCWLCCWGMSRKVKLFLVRFVAEQTRAYACWWPKIVGFEFLLVVDCWPRWDLMPMRELARGFFMSSVALEVWID